jgi:sulfite reductase beta subunit-like hemoprotein
VNRTEELVATGATTIAVACPFCNVMMTDGVKGMDKDESVKVLDVAEIVAQALGGASLPAARTAPVDGSSDSHAAEAPEA